MRISHLRVGAVFCTAAIIILACPRSEAAGPRTDTIYETNYKTGAVELYSARGRDLGRIGTISFPTGLVFDTLGNLYVSSDDPANYAIKKIAPNGTVTVFADTGLSGPHGLAFDKDGNLLVANIDANTIVSFTPAGAPSVFADASDGLEHPVDLIFDPAGNLYVSNAFGGPTHTGSIVKISSTGVASVFADSGFHLAYGLAMDTSGNIYVSNYNSSTIEKFSPTGVDLGVFASAGLHSPHGMIFDSSGYLYVANNSTQTIEKFSATGGDLGAFARTQSGPHFLTMFKPGSH